MDYAIRLFITIFLAALLFATGCASTHSQAPVNGAVRKVHDAFDNKPIRKDPGSGKVDAKSDNNNPATINTRISPVRLPARHAVAPAEQDAGFQSRFDLNVENGPVREVLMSLVKGTRYNMIVHPSVQGDISLSLKQVTIDEVLKSLRSVYGYEFRRTTIGYEVLASGMQTRLFKIDYLNVKRSGESQVRVSSGQLTEVKSQDSRGSNSGGNNGKQKQRTQRSGVLSGSQVSTQSLSDFWLDLEKTLEALVGEADDRKVVVNPQTGVVVVRAMPAVLRDVEDYLNTIQGTIQRQVILEAKIVEVELSEGFQSGINWAAFVGSGDDRANIGQIGGGSVFDSGVSEIAGDNLNLASLSGAEGLASSAFGGVFTMAIGVSDFTAFIEALETQGDVHVLSSPRVSTVNNQKAVIKVGTDEFFVTGIQTETTEINNNPVQSIDVELTPFFSGVALDVIPQINDRGDVTLHIHPSVSEVKERIKELQVSSGTDGALKIPLALSTIRESDSIIRARSGQLVVIGGLMQTVVRDNEAGIPYISQLPILGGLFRHQQQLNVKSELVILLRPIIVDDQGVWSSYLDHSRDQFGQLSGYQVNPTPAEGGQTQSATLPVDEN